MGDWNCNYLHSGRSTCHQGPGALENGQKRAETTSYECSL